MTIRALAQLESLWKQCAIEFMGVWFMLDEKYERCLGTRRTDSGPAIAFLVKGFSETLARRSIDENSIAIGLSILRPNSDGIWYDCAYSMGGVAIGPIAILEPEEVAVIRFNSGMSTMSTGKSC